MPSSPWAGRQRRPWVGPSESAALLAAGAALVLFLSTLSFGFVWDDSTVLFQQLPRFRSLADVLVPPPGIAEFQGAYYRPLVTLSYLLDRAVWGATPFGFHLSVVLLHALNAALVTFLAIRLFGEGPRARLGALTAGALFAAHPMHTESIAWIAGRSDPLATAFVLLACLLWLRARRSPSVTFAAAGLLLLGSLSKEAALGMLPVLLAWDLMRMPRSAENPPVPASVAVTPDGPGARRDPARPAGLLVSTPALAAVAAAFFAARELGLSSYGRTFHPRAEEGSPIAVVRALGYYVRRLLFPVGLDVHVPAVPDPGRSLVIGIVALLASSGLILVSLRRGRGRVAFYILWFCATLAPALAILFFDIGQSPLAERYLYLPSVALCLAIGDALFVGRQGSPATGESWKSRTASVVAMILMLAFSGLTLADTRIWRSDFDLWGNAVAVSPEEGFPHLMLGEAYDRKESLPEAEREYRLAIEHGLRSDLVPETWTNIGMSQADRGLLDDADASFRKALEINEKEPRAYYGLGLTASRRADRANETHDAEVARTWLTRAETLLQEALARNRGYVKAHAQLARVLYFEGRSKEALEHIEVVERLAPNGPESRMVEQIRELIAAPPAR